MDKATREFKKRIEAEGFTVEDVIVSKRHKKVIMSRSGTVFKVFMGSTPSTRGTTLKNTIRSVKQAYRNALEREA